MCENITFRILYLLYNTIFILFREEISQMQNLENNANLLYLFHSKKLTKENDVTNIIQLRQKAILMFEINSTICIYLSNDLEYILLSSTIINYCKIYKVFVKNLNAILQKS